MIIPIWTEEQQRAAYDLWIYGKSASEIGVRFHLSRNQVIGRLHRYIKTNRLPSKGNGIPSMTRQAVRSRKSRAKKNDGGGGDGITDATAVKRLSRSISVASIKHNDRGRVYVPWANSAGSRPLPRSLTPPPEAPDASKVCTLMDLTPSSCRWPVGDWPVRFCGHGHAPGSSYCPYHARQSKFNKEPAYAET